MRTADLTERIPRWSEGKQRVLNAHRVPPRDAQLDLPDVPVRARVEWSGDGAEQLETVAFAASGRLVLVLVSDARCELRGIWFDVRGRGEADLMGLVVEVTGHEPGARGYLRGDPAAAAPLVGRVGPGGAVPRRRGALAGARRELDDPCASRSPRAADPTKSPLGGSR